MFISPEQGVISGRMLFITSAEGAKTSVSTNHTCEEFPSRAGLDILYGAYVDKHTVVSQALLGRFTRSFQPSWYLPFSRDILNMSHTEVTTVTSLVRI